MSDKIEIASSLGYLESSIADELQIEVSEKLENDGILLKRIIFPNSINTYVLFGVSAAPLFLAITITCSTLSGVMAVYAVRLIDAIVEKCKKAKSTEVDKLQTQIVYKANRQGRSKHGFCLPSQASEAIEFFKSLAR